MCAYNPKFWLVDIFIELGHLYGAYTSMDQRSKEFFEITGWNYMLKWLQVEELVKNQRILLQCRSRLIVSDDDATHPFSQKERNDLVCVHLKMVKLLLGQHSEFTKFPRYHERWDAAMTDYCWTLKRDVYLLLIFQGVPRSASSSYVYMKELGTIMMNNLRFLELLEKLAAGTSLFKVQQ